MSSYRSAHRGHLFLLRRCLADVAFGLALLCLTEAFAPPALADDASVDLELVLAVDVSGSMDAEEHRLQRQGYIAALRHPDVLRAIQSGATGRIALTYIEWAGDGLQAIVVPWRTVSDAASGEAFAAELEVRPITQIRRTSISSAIDFSRRLFDRNGFAGLRRVIDVSGDGPNNSGPPVTLARDAAIEQGVVINGLPIMIRPSVGWRDPGPLDAYYTDCVIGGAGAFVLPVREMGEMATAVRHKLVLEIAAIVPPPARVWRTQARPPADCLIGEATQQFWRDN